MNLAQLLARSAVLYPDRPALFHGEDLVCDYRELARRAAAIGSHLSQVCKLVPGERVALFMSNMPEYLELMYGAWYAGLVVVPINAKLHPREAQYIIDDSGAGALFVSRDLAAGMRPLLSELPGLDTVMEPGSDAFKAMYQRAPIAVTERMPAAVKASGSPVRSW